MYMMSLCILSDNDVSEMDIPQPFIVERDRFGKLVHKELKPNGRNVTVTNDNKQEYVRSAGSEGMLGPMSSLPLTLQTVCAVSIQRWNRETVYGLTERLP